ncbi:MAG: hypothetical protein ACJAY7_001132 [Pseudohongiellaceae bacterium]|jgi:hypothetical protein
MKKVVDKVKFVAVKSLTRLVLAALDNANMQIHAQAMKFTKTALPPLREEAHQIAERFLKNLNAHFDSLTTLAPNEDSVEDYDDLSLVDNDHLEAIIAMEGMVNHARNSDIQQYISFSTRLNSLFENVHIDETNNPLDPEQIGDSFNQAIRPLGLKAHYLLTIYREFNKAVFHNLEDVLIEANDVLIKLDVMPDLDIKARNRELQRAKRAANRPTTDAQTRAFSDDDIASKTANQAPVDNQAMFAMMQTLVQGLVNNTSNAVLPVFAATAIAASDSDTAGLATRQKTLEDQQSTLIAMLNRVQNTLLNENATTSGAALSSSRVADTINQTLEKVTESGEIAAIDPQSSDVIHLVTLLFEAIWKDDSLPVVMKELIGRTQISIIKIALSDTTFFGDEQHAGRVILNEFAMAGIAWTEPELLASDPIYMKVKELVEKILAQSDLDTQFLQSCINELRAFKTEFTGQDANLEQRLRETSDHSERLDDVHMFVTQKINERILKSNLDPSIRKVLDTFMHEFLVKLVLKEGPGGSSWKPVMSTIDVLVWSVKTEKQTGDKERFKKVNPRLLDNLEKALEIGGASKSKLTKIMRQLKQVQDFSFHSAELANAKQDATLANANPSTAASASQTVKREPPPLPRNDPHLRQIDKLPIGVWLEFKGVAGTPVRCTLAAKIDSIDKMFFVNRQGVRVVELTRMRLARELKAGSVKIVSEGSLVDRAMESVISKLKDAGKMPSAMPKQD